MTTPNKRHRALWALALIAAAVGFARFFPSRSAVPSDLEGAETAFVRFLLPDARAGFTTIWNDQTQPSNDRIRAGLQLARITGHIDANMPAARDYVAAIAKLGEPQTEAWLLLSELERHSGNFEAAMAAALRIETTSASQFDRTDGAAAWAQAVLSHAIESHWDPNRPGPSSHTIDDAFQKIVRVIERRRGAIGPTETALGLALLTGHGEHSLQLWRDYYRLDQGPVSGVLREPASTLARVLPALVPGQKISNNQREVLVQSLTRSRMHRFAAMVAHDHRVRQKVPP